MNPQTKLQLLRAYEKNPAMAFVNGMEIIHSNMMESLDREITHVIENLPSSTILKGVTQLKGDKGDFVAGPKGDKGETGKQGPEGKKGLKGDSGTDGKNGKDGRNGKDGKKGVDGRDGKDGKDGMNGKDGSPDKPKEIATKLNTLTAAVDQTVINGLPEAIKNIYAALRERKGGGKPGGGMGNWVHESFSLASGQTSVTLRGRVAANSTAILVRYQGQLQAHNTDYSVNDKVVTLTIVVETGTLLDVTYVRT